MERRDMQPEMTLRDTFAAAALTGLLAQGDDGSFSEESYVRAAYRWADAMLRERAKTNHDTAPACDGVDVLSTPDSGGLINRAAHGGQSPARSGESERRDVPQPDNGRAAGGPAHHTQEAADMGETNERSVASTGSVAKDLADSLRGISDNMNVCGNDYSDILYPAARELERLDKLRLTDAEREVIEIAAAWFEREAAKDDYAGGNAPVAFRHATDARKLRGLLSRLGGGE